MRIQFHVVLGALAFLAQCCCSCKEPGIAHRAARPADWDPAYFKAVYDNPASDEYAEEVMASLNTRIRSPHFWEIVGILSHHARDAEYVLLVEKLSDDNHWFAVVVIEKQEAVIYSDQIFPAGIFRPGEYDGDSFSAWGSIEEKSARKLLGMLISNNTWNHRNQFGFSADRPHPRPYLLHVYGRKEGSACFLLDGLFFEPDPDIVLRGRELVPLANEKRPPNGSEFPRLAIEGILKLLHDQNLEKNRKQ